MATKLEKLESTLAEHRARAVELEAEILACDVQEEEARVRALRLDPTKRSDTAGANSEPGRIAKKKREREASLRTLLKEIHANEIFIGELRRSHAEEALQAEIKKARGFRLREMDDWKTIIELFEGLAHAWAIWAEHMTEADHHAAQVDRSGLLSGAAHLTEEWLGAARPVVQPVPLDFMALVTKLQEASADPQGYGTRIEGGIRLAGHALPTLISELPELNKTVSVQGENGLTGNFERSRYDRVRPNENAFQASSSAASDVAASIAAEVLA